MTGVLDGFPRCERAGGITSADVNLFGLAVVDIDQTRRRLRHNAAYVLTADFMEMKREETGSRFTELVQQLSGEPVLKSVPAVGLLKGAIVAPEADDVPAVVNSDEQSAATRVQQRCDSLDHAEF